MESREPEPEPAEGGPPGEPEADVTPSTEAPTSDAQAPTPAPVVALSRHDVYPEPMRAGRPAGHGPVARAMSWLRSNVKSEQQRRESELDEQLGRTPPLSRPNTIAMLSPKGGVGKTTLAFVLGDLLASQLHMRVVALDANPDFGTLASLAGDAHRSPRSLADLLADASRLLSPAELHPYVSRLPSGLHLLGAPVHAEVMAQVTPGLYARLIDFLEGFYEVVILDLGSGVTSALTQFATERADQSILVTTPEWITASGVLAALRYLQLEEGTVVINQASNGRGMQQRDAIVDTFRRDGVTTRAAIPCDQRLHAMLDSGTYAFADLNVSTRVAVKELAATVVSRFV
jgi:MinD-like ATPase involved in chromosome partitioning or flagellar assembly